MTLRRQREPFPRNPTGRATAKLQYRATLLLLSSQHVCCTTIVCPVALGLPFSLSVAPFIASLASPGSVENREVIINVLLTSQGVPPSSQGCEVHEYNNLRLRGQRYPPPPPPPGSAGRGHSQLLRASTGTTMRNGPLTRRPRRCAIKAMLWRALPRPASSP